MSVHIHHLAKTLEILDRTPSVLRALLRDLSPMWTTGNYGEKTWSAEEVVGHLIVAEREDWLPRLRQILDDGEKKPFDPFAHDAKVTGMALGAMLDEFEKLRTENLRELRAIRLSNADLARTGMHPSLGRVTTAQLLSTWAVHDLHHLRQICLAMAWQYRDEVGPWRAYLNTLAR